MFSIGEYIIYGNSGVCLVEDISVMGSGEAKKEYYCLKPVNDREGKIFTPVDNNKVFMRRILSSEEAKKLIDNIPDIEQMWIADERKRESDYKQALQTCDCRELIRIIKTMYLRRRERLARGMKSTVIDDRYLREAENNLYCELSLAMGKEKKEMEAYISERIELLDV